MAEHDSSMTIVTGITQLDWFAAQAIQGILASGQASVDQYPTTNDLAHYAYGVAEAMMRERAKR